MEGAQQKTGRKSFQERYPDFSREQSGAKRLGIDTSFVNPAFKPEVPDYRTEYEVMQAVINNWESDDEFEEENETVVEAEALATEPEDDKEEAVDSIEPIVEDSKIDILDAVTSEVVEAEELTTESDERSNVVEVPTDDAQIDRIINRMRESAANLNTVPKVANINTKPSEEVKVPTKEPLGGAETVVNLDDTKEAVLNEPEGEIVERRTHVSENGNTTASPEPLKRFLKVSEEKIGETPKVEVATNNESTDFSEIEKEIIRLDTDLNSLTQEVDAWKADLQTRKKYRRVKDEIKNLIQEYKDKVKVFSEELLAEKMQRLHDLHEAIFEFEMYQNNMIDDTGEVITPTETVHEVFAENDKPELPFEDLPDETREDSEARVYRQESIQDRNNEIEDMAEIASAAENLMLKELRNKGMQTEWAEGKYFGVVRALSEMRVDDFLRTKDTSDKSRIWLANLQQRAGGFAPHLEPHMILGEYVPKLYQGIIKAQRHGTETNTEGTRTRLLGI